MTTTVSSPSARSARLGLRATPEQGAVLRRAADVAHKSLTECILDSACLAAEQTLLDQRLFIVSGSHYQALTDLLDRPAQPNEGLVHHARQAQGGGSAKTFVVTDGDRVAGYSSLAVARAAIVVAAQGRPKPVAWRLSSCEMRAVNRRRLVSRVDFTFVRSLCSSLPVWNGVAGGSRTGMRAWPKAREAAKSQKDIQDVAAVKLMPYHIGANTPM